MWKEELIPVYEDTISKCASIQVPKSNKYNHILSIDDINEVGKIIVEPTDTVSALVKYSTIGRTAVLNMASSKRKGGGVLKGAVAQEECIFRCSNLFNIPDSYYPLKSDEYVYTEGATFIKDFKYNEMPSVEVDVITMPAINLNKTHIDNADAEIEIKNYRGFIGYKITAMLNIAAFHKCNNIILGAWGCGVFKNDPEVVAKIFKEELEVRRHMFKNVVFAIINDHNSVKNNYEIFKKILEYN